MLINSIKVLTIPIKIKYQLNEYIYESKQIKITGYKIQIRNKYIKIPIIEFENNIRIFLLFSEINMH